MKNILFVALALIGLVAICGAMNPAPKMIDCENITVAQLMTYDKELGSLNQFKAWEMPMMGHYASYPKYDTNETAFSDISSLINFTNTIPPLPASV
jgi:hypothetical protein